MRLVGRSKLGVDIFALQDESEWIGFCRSIVREKRRLDNDLTLIVVAHEIGLKLVELRS